MGQRRTAKEIQKSWDTDARWKGVQRDYTAEDVVKLRGSVHIEHSLARLGAERLWELLNKEPFLRALGCMTGNQAIECVQGGLKTIYCSGWQVAGDANTAGQVYPDQSLYPVNSVPDLVRKINNAFHRADLVRSNEGKNDIYWYAPIVADAEAGFGGNLNAYELMKSMIEAGASGVHYEDQLSSAKKCGHMGGKVLVPTQEFEQKLVAARLAADVADVPTVVVARTDANGANLLTSDIDPRDRKFCTGERTSEGFFRVRDGIDQAIARGLAYAPYADLVWCETSEPNVEEAKKFATVMKAEFPDKLLAYNCSPSFNWKLKLDAKTIRNFQEDLGKMGYKFQFVTLAGWHALNYSMFDLARTYSQTGMAAYSVLQEAEFAAQSQGYGAVKHQNFVGAGYFDAIQQLVAGGESSTTAMHGSTEEEQFEEAAEMSTA